MNQTEETSVALPEPSVDVLRGQAIFWADRFETNLRDLSLLETKSWQALGKASSAAGLLGSTLQRATLENNLHLLNESTLMRLLGMAETAHDRLEVVGQEIVDTQQQLDRLISRIEDHVRAGR